MLIKTFEQIHFVYYQQKVFLKIKYNGVES